MVTENKPKISLIDFLFVIIISYGIAPIVSRIISSTVTTYAYLAIQIFVLLFIMAKSKGVSFAKCFGILAPFIIWKILLYFLNGMTVTEWGYELLLDCIPLLIGYELTFNSRSKLKTYSVIIVLLCTLTIITTIIGSIMVPGAARFLATSPSASHPKVVEYSWRNIGGYELTYIIVLLYPVLILAFKRGKIHLFPTLILTVLIATTIFYTEYTTALLMFIISSLMFFMRRDFGLGGFIIFAVIALILLFTLSDLIALGLNALGDLINNDTVSPRLYALAGGRESLEQFEDNRLILYGYSINSFFNSPLYGSLFYYTGPISGHSFILDTMAKAGLIGIAVMVAMYVTIYKNFYARYSTEKGYGFVLWTFFQVIMLSLINTGMWISVLGLYIPVILGGIFSEERR